MRKSARFHVGQRVLFNGAAAKVEGSLDAWIPAKVIAVSSRGAWVQVVCAWSGDGSAAAVELSRAEVRKALRTINEP